jgi:hypothetical protein
MDSNFSEFPAATFSYTENPGYLDLVLGVYRLTLWDYRTENCPQNYTTGTRFFTEFVKFYHLPLREVAFMFYWSVFFTLVRYALEYFIIRVIILENRPLFHLFNLTFEFSSQSQAILNSTTNQIKRSFPRVCANLSHIQLYGATVPTCFLLNTII